MYIDCCLEGVSAGDTLWLLSSYLARCFRSRIIRCLPSPGAGARHAEELDSFIKANERWLQGEAADILRAMNPVRLIDAAFPFGSRPRAPATFELLSISARAELVALWAALTACRGCFRLARSGLA